MIPALGIGSQEWLERPERQGVHQHANVAALPGRFLERGEHASALLVIGSIAVEEDRPPSGRLDLGADLLDMGHSLAPIEMHAADVVARVGQGERRGLTETATGAKDERPWLSVVGAVWHYWLAPSGLRQSTRRIGAVGRASLNADRACAHMIRACLHA